MALTEAQKEYNRAWKRAHKEKIHETWAKYHEKNREILNQKKVEYRQKNKEKVAAYDRAYRQRNKEKRNAWVHAYNKARRLAPGSHTDEEWEQLKAKYNFMCLSCRKFEPEVKLSRDHVIPFSQSGTNYISNIQPLCVNCNSKKKSKTIDYRLTFKTPEKN